MAPIFFFLVGLLSFARANAFNASISCCQQLYSSYPHQLFAYDNHLAPRWSKTADMVPTCFFFPINADEVSTALRILVNTTCPFSIKSGGHSPWRGMNAISGGVALDLNWINETTLGIGHVVLGTSGTWANAYKKLEPSGVLFPGARAGDVGVGGLTLGGGYSWITPRVGFVADNVINYEIVLADSSIVHANATCHKDLFMALKGGGNNFGIVTRIWLSSFESHALWGGVAAVDITPGVKSPANIAKALDAIHLLTAHNNKDPNAAVAVQFNFNGTNGRRTIGSFLVNTAEPNESLLHKPFMDLQPQIRNSLKQKTMTELSKELSAGWPIGQRYLTTSVGIVNDRDMLTEVQKAMETFCRLTSSVIHPTRFQCTFVYEPLPHFYTDHSTARGGNMLGLNNTNDDYVIVLLQPRWEDPKVDAIMYVQAEQWVEDLRTAYPEKVMPLEYLPYAAPWQDPLGSYGEGNMAFMRQVSEKYDPGRVFQELVPGGFKLDKAGGTA